MANDDGVVLPRRGKESRGEAERAEKVIPPREVSRRRRKARQQEEAEWAAQSGPVEVRRVDPDSHKNP